MTRGHVVANGIAVSVRCDGDVPNLLFSAAILASDLVGTYVTPAIYLVDRLYKSIKV